MWLLPMYMFIKSFNINSVLMCLFRLPNEPIFRNSNVNIAHIHQICILSLSCTALTCICKLSLHNIDIHLNIYRVSDSQTDSLSQSFHSWSCWVVPWGLLWQNINLLGIIISQTFNQDAFLCSYDVKGWTCIFIKLSSINIFCCCYC